MNKLPIWLENGLENLSNEMNKKDSWEELEDYINGLNKTAAKEELDSGMFARNPNTEELLEKSNLFSREEEEKNIEESKKTSEEHFEEQMKQFRKFRTELPEEYNKIKVALSDTELKKFANKMLNNILTTYAETIKNINNYAKKYVPVSQRDELLKKAKHELLLNGIVLPDTGLRKKPV